MTYEERLEYMRDYEQEILSDYILKSYYDILWRMRDYEVIRVLDEILPGYEAEDVSEARSVIGEEIRNEIETEGPYGFADALRIDPQEALADWLSNH